MPLELLLIIARRRKSPLFRPVIYRHNTFLVKGLILYTALYTVYCTVYSTQEAEEERDNESWI